MPILWWRKPKEVSVTINGVDISNWNGAINWPAAAATGIAFALTNCTEGTYFVAPTYAADWAGMKAAGIARGCFHFARPSLSQPAAEAAYFLAHVGPLEPGDVVALDLEDGVGDLSAWALTWLQIVEAAIGFKPLLYSGPWFMDAHGITGNAALSAYGLWLADWGVATPTVPAPWTFYAIWQSSAQGTVAGVPGPCDLDSFNGTVEQFRAYGLPPKPAPKLPTNDDIVAMERYLLAQPPDVAGLIAYTQPFI